VASTPAERQRRSRSHKRGDHSLCDPSRCRGDVTVTSAVTRDVTAEAGLVRPARLGARGRQLWDQMTAGVTLGPAELVLVAEACRLADRLERFDSFLAGESDRWVQFREDLEDSGDDVRIVKVVIDRSVSEARQYAIALKQLVGELRQLRAAAGGLPTPVPRPAPEVPRAAASGGNGVAGVTSLAARLAAKRGSPSAG
jgi:hypothetical protein